MKKITGLLSLIFLLFVALSCGEITGSPESSGVDQALSSEGIFITEADDSNIDEETKARYQEDAEKLAIRFVNNNDPEQTRIPGSLMQSFYNGLIHIFNFDHPEAREATREFLVHARNPSSSREIIVSADTTLPWIDSWRNGSTITGNSDVDDLIKEFDFTLIDYQEFPSTLSTASATLRSDNALNVYAVGSLFEEIDGINSAGPDGITDGSDISVLLFDDHLRYSYTYRFGDCPSGCISSHTWIFNVFTNGSVEFSGTRGSLPEN